MARKCKIVVETVERYVEIENAKTSYSTSSIVLYVEGYVGGEEVRMHFPTRNVISVKEIY